MRKVKKKTKTAIEVAVVLFLLIAFYLIFTLDLVEIEQPESLNKTTLQPIVTEEIEEGPPEMSETAATGMCDKLCANVSTKAVNFRIVYAEKSGGDCQPSLKTDFCATEFRVPNTDVTHCDDLLVCIVRKEADNYCKIIC